MRFRRAGVRAEPQSRAINLTTVTPTLATNWPRRDQTSVTVATMHSRWFGKRLEFSTSSSTMTPPSPYRRWLRFSLRTSLIVMLVVCCGLAYWKHQQQGRRFAFQDESGKWGFVSQHGWVVVEPQYRHAIDYVDGLARVHIDERLCYIDLQGVVRFKLPPGTGSTYPFSEGRLWFESKEGKWGRCDDHGKILVEPTFTAVSPFEDGMAKVAVGGTEDRVSIARWNPKGLKRSTGP